jgi:hypothetical protein
MIKFAHAATVTAAFGALALAAPAAAAIQQVHVNAVVTEITHPSGADGVQIGDTAAITARWDDSKLIDITDADNAYFGGNAVGIRAASLDAPGSGFSMTFRGDTFTQDVFEGVDLGGFGILYPIVLYLGDKFWGFDVLGARPDGFGVGFFSEAEISLGRPPVLVGGFGCCFTFGDESFKGTIDVAHAVFDAVPEPSAWALMIAGFGLAGASLRRRRAVATGSAPRLA